MNSTYQALVLVAGTGAIKFLLSQDFNINVSPKLCVHQWSTEAKVTLVQVALMVHYYTNKRDTVHL